MNKNICRLGDWVEWEVLEDFYADVEGGPEKVEKMKRLCADADDDASLEGERLRRAEVNHEYLTDRRRKLNREFAWTDENFEKLARLDRRIRELAREIKENFARTQRDLDGLIANGRDIYKDYQVFARIEYDPNEREDGKEMPCDDWTRRLLRGYMNARSLDYFSFGDGQEPDGGDGVLDAWGGLEKYGYFVENGMTFYLHHLIAHEDDSLFSATDIVAMKPEYFSVTYEVWFYGR